MHRRREMARRRTSWIALAVLIVAANVQAPASAAAQQRAAEVFKPVVEQGWRSVRRAFQSRSPRSWAAYPVENFRVEEGAVLTQQEVADKATQRAARQCAAATSPAHNGGNDCKGMFDRWIHLRR
jgi:hypothetical protein